MVHAIKSLDSGTQVPLPVKIHTLYLTTAYLPSYSCFEHNGISSVAI